MVLIFFCLFAISNKIYIGSFHLVTIPLPDQLLVFFNIFRSSGRFFWLVGYVLLFVALIGVLRFNRRWSVIVLVLAVLTQWYDTMDWRANQKFRVNSVVYNDTENWRLLLTQVEYLNVYPAFKCGAVSIDKYLFLQRLAAHYNKVINTGYLARNHISCLDKHTVFSNELNMRSIYFIETIHAQNADKTVPEKLRNLLIGKHCAIIPDFYVCVPGTNQEWWRQYAPFANYYILYE